ncbi:hypothetical protein H8958_019045 [Nasalis larvatus]
MGICYMRGGHTCPCPSHPLSIPWQVPHTQSVSLSTGSCVTVKGTPILPFINDPQLQVDFHTEMCEKSDIAFHFRVYFGHFVVMNSRECGSWKCEMRCNNVPFEDGKPFELCISVLDNEYQLLKVTSYVLQHSSSSTSLRPLEFHSLPPPAHIWATPKRNWVISNEGQS